MYAIAVIIVYCWVVFIVQLYLYETYILNTAFSIAATQSYKTPVQRYGVNKSHVSFLKLPEVAGR